MIFWGIRKLKFVTSESNILNPSNYMKIKEKKTHKIDSFLEDSI